MAMDGIASFLERVKALREHESLHDLMMDPTARVLLGVVVGALLMVLVFLQPYPEEVEEQERKAPKEREQRGYSRKEVAQHKTEGDLWIIIRHKDTNKLQVYDVSSYVEHHPGGDAIFTHAGDDCTEGFRGPQHPPTVWELVSEYCIGWVEDP